MDRAHGRAADGALRQVLDLRLGSGRMSPFAAPSEVTGMKLYYHPVSSYSQKVLIACYEKQAPFEPSIVDLFDPAARAEYVKVYPLGKVPCLVRNDGVVMGESSVIIEYLDTHVISDVRLIPQEQDQALRVRALDRWFDLYVNDPMATLFFNGLKPESERNQKSMQEARATLDKMYPILDASMRGKEWAAGDRFTMADCAAAPALHYCRMVYGFDQFEHLAAYVRRLEARPSFAKVLAEAAPYLARLKR